MRRFSILCLALAATVSFMACGKEGPTGPAGQTGATGANGANGATGATGAKGDPGTGSSSVVYSDWFIVNKCDSVASGTDWVYYVTIAAPKCDSLMVATGTAKLYARLIVNGTEAAIDATQPSYGMTLMMVRGGLYMEAVNFNFSKTPLRYVLIPSGVKAASQVNWNIYSDVQKFLHFKN